MLLGMLAIIYIVALSAVSVVLSGGLGLYLEIAAALALPAGVATAAAAALFGPPLRQRRLNARWQIGLRAGLGWAVVGGIWPLLNTTMDVLANWPPDVAFSTIVFPTLRDMALGALIGFFAGALGGAIASLPFTRRV
jgi:hypothetical protein